MSLAFGRQIVAIPGPSPVPDRVLRAMHRASPDIYAPELAELNLDLIRRLKWVAGTSGHVAPYIGNGHAAWQAVTANLFNRGDRALLLASGHFGRSWADTMRAEGVEVEVVDCGGTPPDPSALAERLAADHGHTIRAVMVCQTDTASSVSADVSALRSAMGDHPALFVVDAIASLGCSPMLMDEWHVDVLISASQKGLMTPPGTSFVWFSERAAARGPVDLGSPYWDWSLRAEAEPEALWRFWGGTAPVQQIYGLIEALTMLEEEGLTEVWARHGALAGSVWAAFDAWGADASGIALAVAEPYGRAHSVTAARIPGADALRLWLSERAGVTLGIGLGAADPANALRVAHMGHVNAGTMLGILAAMEAGMQALSIPHGPGAVDAAASVIAARA